MKILNSLPQRNTIIFERFECLPNRNGMFSSTKCEMKRISRDNIKVLVNISLVKPVKDVWVHGVFYHKYTRFQKFPIDLWENLCAWLSGKGKSYFGEWGARNLLNYSNVNHSCPYDGNVIVKADNFSLKDLLNFEVFLPSGRFRMDVNLTEGYRKRVFFISKTYFSVSDHRIEQF